MERRVRDGGSTECFRASILLGFPRLLSVLVLSFVVLSLCILSDWLDYIHSFTFVSNVVRDIFGDELQAEFDMQSGGAGVLGSS